MNLAWITGIALHRAAREDPPLGRWMERATGIMLFAWGALALAIAA